MDQQASCEWGRDRIDSWGRRKRSVDSALELNADEEDMTLTQEILVLDVTEETPSAQPLAHNSQFDFDWAVFLS